MANKLETAAKRAVDLIANFDSACKIDEYTDTNDAWEILNTIREELAAALKKPWKGGR